MHASLKRATHKTLVFLHKWLGVGLALLFLMWFVSGVVLYFVPFPNLDQSERMTGLRPLQLPKACCLTAQQAAGKAAFVFSEARLGMSADGPVWRLLGTPVASKQVPAWRAVDAQSGALLAPLSVDAARRVAEIFSGRRAVASELLERDQWTVPQGLNPYRPLLRIEMDGPDGLELYVSPTSSEVVRDTRRGERFWNWLGAVPHWIYFTELRRYPDAWHNVVVWLSLPGVILAVTGMVLGVWHLFLNRVRWIPYRAFWMKWHHVGGLVAATFTLTWIFSGLMSMNPFGVFSPTGALATERAQWAGLGPALTLDPAQALAQAQVRVPGFEAKEMDLLQVAGQNWYRLSGTTSLALVRADAASGKSPDVIAALPDEIMQTSLRKLRPDAAQAGGPSMVRLTEYDHLYYARELNSNTPYTRPLPVWRAQWADGVTIYADPVSSRLLLRADASTSWKRVLYNGLHSFDFAPLMERPWLRNTLVILLSLLGTALCVTSCVIAWWIFFPHKNANKHKRKHNSSKKVTHAL